MRLTSSIKCAATKHRLNRKPQHTYTFCTHSFAARVFPKLATGMGVAVFVWATVGVGVNASGSMQVSAYVMAAVVAIVAIVKLVVG